MKDHSYGGQRLQLKRNIPHTPTVVCVGSATIDHTFEVTKLPAADDAGVILSESMFFGGRGVVPSVTLAHLGCNPLLFTAVGRDFSPSGFESFLRDSGVDVALLAVDDSDDCFSTHIYYEHGTGQTYTFFRPRNLTLSFSTGHERAIVDADCMYMAINMAFDFDSKAIAVARASGTPIVASIDNGVLSLAPRDYLEGLIEAASAILFNSNEWRILSKTLGIRAHAALFARSTNLMCIYQTSGSSAGTGFLRNGSEFPIPVEAVREVKSTAGAGDTFAAGILDGLLRGLTFAHAGERSAVLASDSVKTSSPTMSKTEVAARRAASSGANHRHGSSQTP